jgi:hypothetical protein
VGQTLCNNLANELLCIGVAMGLAVSCLPGGTWCRCYPVSISTIALAHFVGEAVAVSVVAAKALELRVHTLAGGGFQLLATALLGLLLLVRFAAA